jgi:hypothetical protein
MFQLHDPVEDAFWRGFWEGFFDAFDSSDSLYSDPATGYGNALGILVLAYVLLSYLFVILPWQRIISKAGFRGQTRRNLRILMWSSPFIGPLTLVSAISPMLLVLVLGLYLLMPLVGFLWIAFAPWPIRQQSTPKPQPKPAPTLYGEIDMLTTSNHWVVRCEDGVYWIREEELQRVDLPLATRLGKIVKFVPIPDVTIPPGMVGQITGVVRNGLTQVVA